VRPQDVATRNSEGGDPIVRAERGDHWFRSDWAAVRARVEAAEPAGTVAATGVQAQAAGARA
jgi:hypothetical protein